MSKERVIRAKLGPQVGTIIELLPPWPSEGGRWIVTEVRLDPDATWEFLYDGEEPGATPGTVLLQLSAVR